jgi:amino acid permease
MPWDYKSFITHYIGIPVYVISYIGYKCESGMHFTIIEVMDRVELTILSDSSIQGSQDVRDGFILRS